MYPPSRSELEDPMDISSMSTGTDAFGSWPVSLVVVMVVFGLGLRDVWWHLS